MIAAKSNIEDQSAPAAQIRNLLDAEEDFVDEKIAEGESAEQF